MLAVIRTKTALSDDQLTQQLRALRAHCLVNHSHFAVTAIFEFCVSSCDYIYVSGVNVENTEHNRLSLHAEQNAIASALTLLGPNAQFTKAWIMGAPIDTTTANNHFTDGAVTACGHCRQILLSVAANDAQIYAVTLNGIIMSPQYMTDLLPNAFSDHGDSNTATQSINLTTPAPLALLTRTTPLTQHDIHTYLSAIKPRIINPQFQTSAITTCILHTTMGHYIPGALIQDIAFLTTDALFAGIGFAVTQFGQDLELANVYLLGNQTTTACLSGCEIQLLKRFSNAKTRIEYFTPTGNATCLTY